MLSYWEHNTYFSSIDTVIIGSGIVGLNAAINLKIKKPASKIIVLERGFLPAGASTKNAGFACFGSPSEILEDISTYGEDKTFQLVEKRYKGLKRLIALLGEENMGFTGLGGYEVYDKKDEFQKCADKLAFLNSKLKTVIGENVFAVDNNAIKTFELKKFNFLISCPYEAQIDTGKMMDSLINKALNMGIKILNGINIENIFSKENSVELYTDKLNFVIKSKGVIVATNGFAKQLIPKIKVNPARAQVLITKPIKDLKLKGSFHYDKGFYYFRNVGNRVLLGGGRNLDIAGETTFEPGLTDMIQQRLETLLAENILPGKKYQIDMRWSGIMGIEKDKSYIIKPIHPNVICAVRMGGMGVALGSLVGEEVADQYLRMQ